MKLEMKRVTMGREYVPCCLWEWKPYLSFKAAKLG